MGPIAEASDPRTRLSTMADRYQPPSERVRQWVESALGSRARIVATSRLRGGLTADMDRLTVGVGSGQVEVVLRRWSDHLWGSGLVDREAAGLTVLADQDLPVAVPQLLAADASGDNAGEPCLLMTALPGASLPTPSDFIGCAEQTAVMLARLHAVDATGLAHTDPHGFDERRIDAWIRDPGLAQAVKEATAEPVASSPQVFVHGDYQLLNMLWQGPRLSGVVDWTYAGAGSRAIDVGLCRLSLAVPYSPPAAESFLRQYEAEASVTIDPRADIRSLLSFGPSWLEFVSSLTGRGPVDRHQIADRVTALLRAAVARL